MKTTILLLFAFAFVLILNNVALAQGFPPMLPDAPDQAPIDGGLSLLAAAGGVYAYNKLRRKED